MTDTFTDHCIDHIRQSLQCFGDVSPTGFFFDPKRGNIPRTEGTHMCKNFDLIKKWALERQILNFSMQDKILGTGAGDEKEHGNSNAHGGHHHHEE
jgi:hypothetical protein